MALLCCQVACAVPWGAVLGSHPGLCAEVLSDSTLTFSQLSPGAGCFQLEAVNEGWSQLLRIRGHG